MSTTPPADDDRTQYVPPPGPGTGAAAPAAGTPSDVNLPAPSGVSEVDFEPTQLAPGAASGMSPTVLAPPPASALASNPPPSAGSQLAPAPKAGASASSAGDSGNALPVGTYLSEFELTGVLGEGGFGIVYHAWDHSLQRKVALKEYMPSSLASRERTAVVVRSLRHKETFDAGLKSFINEARLLAQFEHPSLVKVYRFWEANGTAYMVMPLYEGTTLKDKLRAMGGKPDEAWLMSLLAPLTDALATIHKENCFHRDIAPDNIMLLAGSERPLLLDFGAARRVIGDMTQALTVILKPGYAPVEQYAESPDMKQGSWTDVYALAATIHWAIMGKTPPPSVSRLMNDSFQPLSKTAAGRYSERFLAAMDHALAVRPENRTPTIAAFRADVGIDAGHWSPPVQMATPGGFAPPPGGTLYPGQQPVGYPPQQHVPTAMTGMTGMQPMAPGAMPPGGVPGGQTVYAPTQYHPNQPTAMPGTMMPGTMMPGTVMPERPDERTMMAPRNASGGFEKTQMAMETRAAAEAGQYTGTLPGRTSAPSQQAPAASGNKSMVWIGAAAALLIAGGVGGYMVLNSKKAPAPVAVAPAQAPVQPTQPVNPPPPPPPAQPTAFNVREQFDLVMKAQTPGFTVEALAERKDLSIAAKHKLFFDVLSARDGYLHVLVRGPDGSLTMLFPNDKMKEGRVKAGQRIRLPHKQWEIEVGPPAGTEQLLVIVSNTPRDLSSIAEEKAFDYRTVPVGDRANQLLQKWTGPKPILFGTGPAGCQGPQCDEYGAAMFTVQVVP